MPQHVQMTRRRLQVFVSSTYLDLKEERQAAVLAISEAQHIPDGMELFAAGKDSQLERIKRRIDESDVYMLILGHRYGSIEPKSGKSYTRFEHDYAVEKGKPVLAVVMSDDWLDAKLRNGESKVVSEQKDPTALIKFREDVMGAILVKIVDDCKDLSKAVILALREIEGQSDLVGWVRGDIDQTRQELEKENARLVRELAAAQRQNAAMAERLTKAKGGEEPDWAGLHISLSNNKINFASYLSESVKSTFSAESLQKLQSASLLLLLLVYRNAFTTGIQSLPPGSLDSALFHYVAPRLKNLGLIEDAKVPPRAHYQSIRLSKKGNDFLSWIDELHAAKKSSPNS